jgi:Polyketide cyclase / dehydrase and lipid transport
VADNRGRFTVEPAGDGARIVWESSFVVLDPAAEAEFARQWAGMLRTVLSNLKALIEQP